MKANTITMKAMNTIINAFTTEGVGFTLKTIADSEYAINGYKIELDNNEEIVSIITKEKIVMIRHEMFTAHGFSTTEEYIIRVNSEGNVKETISSEFVVSGVDLEDVLDEAFPNEHTSTTVNEESKEENKMNNTDKNMIAKANTTTGEAAPNVQDTSAAAGKMIVDMFIGSFENATLEELDKVSEAIKSFEAAFADYSKISGISMPMVQGMLDAVKDIVAKNKSKQKTETAKATGAVPVFIGTAAELSKKIDNNTAFEKPKKKSASDLLIGEIISEREALDFDMTRMKKKILDIVLGIVKHELGGDAVRTTPTDYAHDNDHAVRVFQKDIDSMSIEVTHGYSSVLRVIFYKNDTVCKFDIVMTKDGPDIKAVGNGLFPAAIKIRDKIANLLNKEYYDAACEAKVTSKGSVVIAE